MEILKSVVEQQCIDLPFVDGEPATFHPVFIHEHDYILQVVSKHVGLVSRGQ
jgi:hypothetical protein